MLKAHAANLMVVALALCTALSVSLAVGLWDPEPPHREAHVRTPGQPIIAR